MEEKVDISIFFLSKIMDNIHLHDERKIRGIVSLPVNTATASVSCCRSVSDSCWHKLICQNALEMSQSRPIATADMVNVKSSTFLLNNVIVFEK